MEKNTEASVNAQDSTASAVDKSSIQRNWAATRDAMIERVSAWRKSDGRDDDAVEDIIRDLGLPHDAFYETDEETQPPEVIEMHIEHRGNQWVLATDAAGNLETGGIETFVSFLACMRCPYASEEEELVVVRSDEVSHVSNEEQTQAPLMERLTEMVEAWDVKTDMVEWAITEAGLNYSIKFIQDEAGSSRISVYNMQHGLIGAFFGRDHFGNMMRCEAGTERFLAWFKWKLDEQVAALLTPEKKAEIYQDDWEAEEAAFMKRTGYVAPDYQPEYPWEVA